MANLINADPTAGLKLVSSSSSDIQIQSNGVTVCTINANGLSMNTGTLAGNGPAIRVHIGGSAQSIGNATFTKLQFNTEIFDTTSDFDTTNYRFTPSVEGYYLITVNGFIASLANATNAIVTIYKNGSEVHRGTQVLQGGTSSALSVASGLLYMNGSTDYVEGYIYHNNGSSRNANADERYNNMTAFLARAV